MTKTEAMQQCPADHPMMKAWEAYRATDEYSISKYWAMLIDEQREQHVDGSLWAAFTKGWEAGQGIV